MLYGTLIKYGAIIVLIAGLFASLWYQSVKVKSLKADLVTKQAKLDFALKANKEWADASSKAEDRYNRMAKSYEERLKKYTKYCQDIINDCNLPPTNPNNGGKNDKTCNGNALCLRYNSLYP